MLFKQLANNRNIKVILLAAYIALEGYLITLAVGYTFGRFWLSNVVFQLFGVFVAYILLDSIRHLIKGSVRKKVVIAIAMLIGTIFITIVIATISLYLQKLQLQSTFN
jgi:hypothetical protein